MEKSKKVKIRTVTIDTLTGLMNELFMKSKSNPSFDKWKDWGSGIWNLISSLQSLGFEIILILGEPGTGKSSGMRTLDLNTNIWFNADNKNPVWIGGKEQYGKKTNPKSPFHIIPKSYDDIINHIKSGLNKGSFEDERYAILTGHIEEYKTANTTKQRLKILGNISTKMQLEGRLETVLYSNVIKEGSDTKYILETENNGYNTARSPMGVFNPSIENDYKFVINKLISY